MFASLVEIIVSDRQLIEHGSLLLNMLCSLACEVDEDLPWHSTFSRTRQLAGS